MEYCTGGDLQAFINESAGKKEHYATYHRFIDCILKGVNILHSNKQMHRDIKPLNIFLQGLKSDMESLTPKLGDFGISVDVNSPSQSLLTVGIGTPWYMAPEQLEGKMYSLPADMWAVGVIFYQLLSGKHPFKDHPG